MNSKQKLVLVVTLVTLLLALSATLALAGSACPPSAKIYIGGPVTDAAAARGSEKNPVANRTEAKDVCLACGGGAYLYEYRPLQGKYVYYNVCVTVFPEASGAPLAQSALVILLVVMAVGLLGWGLYTRGKLRRA